ncbi:MAG: heme-binding domain-containing protein [Chitinophagaceae bacterium]|nr:heme-binding domain-containing protein [Chitinophagaceae bacterium]
MIKKIFYVLIAALVIIQFIRPKQNIAAGPFPADVSTKFAINDNVASILKTACYDCHSNNTTYPWYANVQPVNWWLTDHVNEGKKELNFSEFAGYTAKRQRKKFNEIMDEVKEGKMPLKSYTWMHGNAKLTEAQKNALYKWCEESIATLPPAEPSQQSDNNKSTPQ